VEKQIKGWLWMSGVPSALYTALHTIGEFQAALLMCIHQTRGCVCAIQHPFMEITTENDASETEDKI
jgi:hypothetical protein